MIAPDLRGFGDSGLAPDDRYDVAAHARDMEALVRGELGHERCVVCAGDLGGVVAQDLSLRFEGLVDRLVLFNTIPPVLPDAYREAGPGEPADGAAADYFVRQSRDADGLAAELDTPERRRAYVAQMYGPRFWAAPGAFAAEDMAFMTEPFGDAERFRASIANYEYVGRPAHGARAAADAGAKPHCPTLVLYGPEDHVIPRDFPRRMEVAFPEIVGPFVVAGAGHFLMWERPRAESCNRRVLPGPPGTIVPAVSEEATASARLRAGGLEGRADRRRRRRGGRRRSARAPRRSVRQIRADAETQAERIRAGGQAARARRS